MAQGRARAVTLEQFDEIMRRDGGGPRNNGDGLLSGLWKRWAMTLVAEKRDALEARDDMSLEECIELNALKTEFDRVERDADAAYRAVMKYSPLMNAPFVKTIFS